MEAEASAEAATGPAPSILSAHLSQVDAPELEGMDGVLVVFDVELDAASLDPRVFFVSRSNAGPVRPRRALLAPANEDDENRSVLLVGDFGATTEDEGPTHVAVSGPLFSEDGTRLSGLGASVEPFGAAARVVAHLTMDSKPGRCESAGRLVRTYWSDVLRGVEPDDLERIEIEIAGAIVRPVAFDDHATEHGESGEDNVLDLCLPPGEPISRVRLEPGAFQDAAGHESSGAELVVANSTTPS